MDNKLMDIYHGYYYYRLLITGSTALFIGLVITFLFLLYQFLSENYENYKKTEIISIKNKRNESSLTDYKYDIITTYKYKVNGKIYKKKLNNHVVDDKEASNIEEDMKNMKTVYYDPKNPKYSVISKDRNYWVGIITGVIFSIIGGVMIAIKDNKNIHHFMAVSDVANLFRKEDN